MRWCRSEIWRGPLPRLLRRGRRAACLPPLWRRGTALAQGPRPRWGGRGRRARWLLVRRLPARRRHRALLAADGDGHRVRPRGRPRPRDLQRLPGALRGGAAPRRAAAEPLAAIRLPPGRRGRREPKHPVHARVRAGRGARGARQAHDRPLLRAGRPRGAGRSALRAGTQPQRCAGRHRRRVQRRRQRARADAAPRARVRPAHRVGRRRPPVRVARHGARGVSGSALAPHRELGLTDAEYDAICERMEREPNALELAVFSLMWSEHCAYKHSKKLLRKLPVEGAHLLMGPGENAGVVDVGDGLAVAFKVESHNHPSAVEPFQGAATGVGGILRDIFAVGARPIAVLDSLRFGELDSQRSRYLLERVVAGIGHYGNSVGVATVGGEIYFEGPYEQNCLVNAMCLGIAPHERLTRAAAVGIGNHVVLLGALTGRDGIGGASVLASAELGEGDEAKRPSVQIGDPFEEKKLIECCLELLDLDLLASLQDLGAAGLTSSSSEMASKGQVGIDLDMAEVPLREADMEPFEIMISESQERMLCVVEPQLLDAVFEVCQRWEVRATAIGTVTDGNRLRVFDGDDLVGEMPVDVLVDGCPLYDLEPEKPAGLVYTAPAARIGDADNVLLALLRSPSIASKLWAFEQYDPLVGSRTVRRPAQAEAAVLHLLHDGGHGAVAVSLEGNGRRVACDPYVGAAEAVLECAANLACVGAEPLGLTNCLNFGNPEKPHIAWQLTQAVEGLA